MAGDDWRNGGGPRHYVAEVPEGSIFMTGPQYQEWLRAHRRAPLPGFVPFNPKPKATRRCNEFALSLEWRCTKTRRDRERGIVTVWT